MSTTSAEASSTTADLDGFRLHYHDIGSGPVVVFLHGGGPGASSWSNYKQNVPALAEHFRLILVDMPGFGGSDKPVHALPQHELTLSKVVELLDHLGIDKASFVGNSLGGAACLEIALEQPHRVDKMVLLAPAGGSLAITSQPSTATRALFDYYAPPGPTLDGMRAVAEALSFDVSTVPEETLVQRYEASLDREGTDYQVRMFEKMHELGPEHWKRVNEIAHPTLIVWGREDRVLPLDTALHMAHQMPNARLVVYPNCGHWCQVEVASDFDADVINFLHRPS